MNTEKELVNIAFSSIDFSGEQSIQEAAASILDAVKNGYACPLKVKVLLAYLEKTVSTINADPDFQEALSKEYFKTAGKGKEVKVFGAKLTHGKTGSKYHFDHIPAWEALQVKRKKLEEEHLGSVDAQIKGVETEAKALIGKFVAKSNVVLDEDTGEIAEVVAARNTYSEKVIITIQ